VKLSFLILAIVGWFSSAATQAAHTRARLLLPVVTARAGDQVMAGVELQMDAKWHTYWRNAGDSGLATTIEWDLPKGIEAGEILWPLPKKLTEEGLTTYVYTKSVVLLVPLKLAPQLPPGRLKLKAKVSWLECEVKCIPGEAQVEADLEIGSQTKASPDTSLITAAQKQLPKNGVELAARAWWEKENSGDTRSLVLECSSPDPARQAEFFPYAAEQFEVLADAEMLPAKEGKIRLRKKVRKLSGDWPRQLSGVLIQFGSETERSGYEIKVPVRDEHPAALAPRTPLDTASVGGA
jgi:thiol:disulfide interchange protein DsbD